MSKEEFQPERVWTFVEAIVILAALGMIIAFILAPKNVDYYYLSHGANSQSGNANCVYAHWTWHNDEVAFCTDDYQKAIDFTAKSNATLRTLHPEAKP